MDPPARVASRTARGRRQRKLARPSRCRPPVPGVVVGAWGSAAEWAPLREAPGGRRLSVPPAGLWSISSGLVPSDGGQWAACGRGLKRPRQAQWPSREDRAARHPPANTGPVPNAQRDCQEGPPAPPSTPSGEEGSLRPPAAAPALPAPGLGRAWGSWGHPASQQPTRPAQGSRHPPCPPARSWGTQKAPNPPGCPPTRGGGVIST